MSSLKTKTTTMINFENIRVPIILLLHPKTQKNAHHGRKIIELPSPAHPTPSIAASTHPVK